MITSFQMRAARALLGIDQKALAELAGVSLPTIQRMEASTGTVRVTFANGANFNEYDVKASVAVGAVTGLNSGLDSTLGSVPVGDNAGAFARGRLEALWAAYARWCRSALQPHGRAVWAEIGRFSAWLASVEQRARGCAR